MTYVGGVFAILLTSQPESFAAAFPRDNNNNDTSRGIHDSTNTGNTRNEKQNKGHTKNDSSSNAAKNVREHRILNFEQMFEFRSIIL